MAHSPNLKVDSFNVRVDPALKAAFTAAAEDEPAGQVLRDFMRAYVERQTERTRAAQARQYSRILAERAADPASDETEVIRWIEDVADTEGWTA